jgi:hypothetical protein
MRVVVHATPERSVTMSVRETTTTRRASGRVAVAGAGACIWLDKPTYPPFMMMGRAGLRTILALDRFNDRFNGHKRRARRAAAHAS